MICPKIDTEMFIWEVQNRPALWDVTSSDYGKVDKKKQCWEEIIDIFANEDADENERQHYGMMLQKRWKNLRGCFTRELMRQRSCINGIPTKRKSHYVYFNNLLFLKEAVRKIRKAKRELQNNNRDDSFSGADEKSPDETEDTSEIEDQNIENDLNRQDSGRKYNHFDSDSPGSTKDNRVQENTIHEEDDEKLFLLSLVKPLKRVPEEDRLSVQMEIMNVINKAIQKTTSYSPPSNRFPATTNNMVCSHETQELKERNKNGHPGV